MAASNRVPTGFANEIVVGDATFRQLHLSHERNHEPPTKKRKREARGDSSIVNGPRAYKGPWARPQEYQLDAIPRTNGNGELASDEEEVEEIVEVSEYEEDALPERSLVAPKKGATAYDAVSDTKESSEFLGSQQYDYQGRTYMHVPQDLGISLTGELPALSERQNYHPKKLVHTFKDPRSSSGKAHERSITQTRFFPDSGHLLLSAGADGKVLLWDVYHKKELLRAYNGHNKSVSDIDFAPDGRHFMSASYDRQMKYWDTETGQCLGRFSTGATPHVVRMSPTRPNEFIAGMGDKKIVQFDTRSNEPKPKQEYDHHLGPVNTLTFVDGGNRFMSTSDDKSLRAWEIDIPVPIKFIAEPYMYPLVRSSLHPSGKYVAYQSADNQIVVYNSTDKFRQHKKKGFRGHNTSGYAIDVALSPAGNIIASGDSAGFACFWDWKTGRLWHKLQAGKDGAAVVALQWHPRETSKVVTGDVSGVLRYWD